MPSDEVLIDAAVYAEDEYGSRGDCGEEIDRYYLEKAAEPIRALIRTAVEWALAEERARHAQEVEKAREALEIAIEYARHGGGCSAAFGENYRCRCGWNESKVEIEAALAALEEG